MNNVNYLSPWEKVQIARHAQRPQTSDYVNGFVKDFFQLSGDRAFAEDAAIICGIGTVDGVAVVICGHEKGRDIEARKKCNFGMAHPEGYRKFLRAAKFAETYQMPLVTLVDTPGAYPGIKAEERGQAYVIADCMYQSFCLTIPTISVIIGEGGSGGAIALATANKVLMLENSVYSVISPEGCAAILWKTRDRKEEAAAKQKITAQDLLEHDIIDEIIVEPDGGAHMNYEEIILNVKNAILRNIKNLYDERRDCRVEDFQSAREEKFLKMTREFLI